MALGLSSNVLPGPSQQIEIVTPSIFDTSSIVHYKTTFSLPVFSEKSMQQTASFAEIHYLKLLSLSGGKSGM